MAKRLQSLVLKLKILNKMKVNNKILVEQIKAAMEYKEKEDEICISCFYSVKMNVDQSVLRCQFNRICLFIVAETGSCSQWKSK